MSCASSASSATRESYIQQCEAVIRFGEHVESRTRFAGSAVACQAVGRKAGEGPAMPTDATNLEYAESEIVRSHACTR